jgi:hypothetical protein
MSGAVAAFGRSAYPGTVLRRRRVTPVNEKGRPVQGGLLVKPEGRLAASL